MPRRCGVDVGQRLQVVDARELVFELRLAHVLVDRRLEGVAAAGGPAIVHGPDQEAAAGQELVEGAASQPLRHDLNAGTAVHVDHHRIPFLRIEGGGLQEPRRRATSRHEP